jgi:hypothetical protein
MTEDRLPLAELLQKAGEGDFLRAVAEAVLQLLMEADVEGLIGAGRHERSPERLNWRSGYRERCPSSDDLRRVAGFRSGGSGPSGFEVRQPARDGASDGPPGSGV